MTRYTRDGEIIACEGEYIPYIDLTKTKVRKINRKLTATMYANAKRALPALKRSYLNDEIKAAIDLCLEIS